jgi:hypothetical protein
MRGLFQIIPPVILLSIILANSNALADSSARCCHCLKPGINIHSTAYKFKTNTHFLANGPCEKSGFTCDAPYRTLEVSACQTQTKRNMVQRKKLRKKSVKFAAKR